MRRLAASTAVVLLLGFSALAGSERLGPGRPRFLGGADGSASEGHATLSWSLPGEHASPPGVTFELQQSRDRGFDRHRLRYRGSAESLFVSGLREGRSYFRVRALRGETAGPWSDPRVVEVDYPGRGQVLMLLLLGCVVFLATVGAIVSGWARHRRGGFAGQRARS